MAADQDGRTIAVDDKLLVVGKVKRIDGGYVLLQLADGASTIRVRADEVLRVDDLVTRAHAGAGQRYFTAAPASLVGPSTINDLIRDTDLTASQSAQDATTLAILAAFYVPLAALSAQTQSMVGLTTAAAWCAALKATYVAQTVAEQAAIGASSTAYADLASVTIPAGALGTNGMAELLIEATAIVNTGNTKAKVLVNGSSVWENSGNALTAGNTTPYQLRMRFTLSANGSTSSQRGGFDGTVGDSVAGTTGTGGWGYAKAALGGKFADSTVNSTSAITFQVQTGFATSHASNYFRLHKAVLLIHPG